MTEMIKLFFCFLKKYADNDAIDFDFNEGEIVLSHLARPLKNDKYPAVMNTFKLF